MWRKFRPWYLLFTDNNNSVWQRCAVCQLPFSYDKRLLPTGNESVQKIIINNTINLLFKATISILPISNHNCFRVLFDKIAFVYFIGKICLDFSIGNGQPREPALCQLYQHTFVPYASQYIRWDWDTPGFDRDRWLPVVEVCGDAPELSHTATLNGRTSLLNSAITLVLIFR